METFTRTIDDFITGDSDIVTKAVTIGTGADVAQYTVLGQIAATGKFIPSVATATDGSETPVAISAVAAAAAAADVVAPVYLGGTVNPDLLVWDASFTAALKSTAFIGTPITLVAPKYSGA